MADTRAAGLGNVEIRERVAHLDDLLERLERVATPGTETAMEAIELLTEVYGTALRRLVAMLEQGDVGVADAAADELIGHLMVLHDIHPDPKVAQAILTSPDAGPPRDAGPTLIPAESLLHKPATV